MDNFVVSARKYRPASFDMVVGQKALTATLKNSIKNNHLAHAYLFCGPRGVGKTTCARIFAKTINCSALTPDYNACDKCDSCVSFNTSRSFNIHELDAASNNSVEDIRLLIDKVRIPPQMGKYSVYIIDEVHMLSAAAFNSFLKTLEEPPAHAIFILATTEKHKIIPTILSRCQIYDFVRIKIEDIVEQLQFVAKNENVTAEPEALGLIAQKADGAMRDALSIFDQLVNFSGGNITYQNTLANLNVLDYDFYFNLTDCFLNSDVKKALLIFNEILDKGFDGQHFISGLGSHFRDLLVCKDEATVQLLEVGASIKQKYLNQAAACEQTFLYQAMKIANECNINYKLSQNKRFHVELSLLKLSYIMEEKKKPDNIEVPVVPEKKTSEPTIIKPDDKQIIATENKQVEVNLGQDKASDNDSVIQRQVENVTPSISINQLIKNSEEEKKKEESLVANSIEKKLTLFDNEQLIDNLKSFSSQFEKTKPRLFNALTSCSPTLLDDFAVEVSFINDLQESIFNDVKFDFLEFLKENLHNNQISIVTKIESKLDDKQLVNRLYTDDDKFKFMCTQNPDLAVMKDVFKLDFC
ncbi:MAG: DNA polymerase III subunit gamma/tau [Bacteroidales bacterium]|nr:DNA polymerase III subunit gamma/tau [Bacteroidales bacterium]